MYADDASRMALGRLDTHTVALMEDVVAARCYYIPPRLVGDALGALVPDFRSLAYAFMRRGKLKENRDAHAALPALVDLLIERGRLVISLPSQGKQPGLCLVTAARTDAAPGENAAAYRRRLVERIAPGLDGDQKARLEWMFHCIRRLEHCCDTRYGTLRIKGRPSARFAIALPQIVGIGPDGPTALSALAFFVNARGRVQTARVGPDRLSASFFEDGWQVMADLGGVRANPDGLRAVGRILPRVELHAQPVQHLIDWDHAETWLGFPVPGRARKSFMKALDMGKKSYLSLAAALLRRELDSVGIAEAARIGSEGRLETYDWFVGAPSKVVAGRRMQAARAYPLLAPALVTQPALRAAVDAGLPLAPLLSSYTTLSRSALKRVGRLHWQRTGAYTALLLSRRREELDLASLLNACPPERLPATRADWKGFLAFGEEFRSTQETLWWHPRRVDGTLVREWVGNASRDWVSAGRAGIGMHDMMQNVARRVADAVACHAALRGRAEHRDGWMLLPAVQNALVAGSRPTMGSLSERGTLWHARADHLRREMAAAARPRDAGADVPPTPSSWPPLDVDFDCEDGTIRWLTTQDALDAETEALGHCVWSYAPNCLYVGSHIGSVVDRKGNRSTVEIRSVRTGDAWTLEVHQNRGHGNKLPARGCCDAVKRFLASRTGMVRHEWLSAALASRCAIRPVTNAEGYDWEDEAFCDAVIDLYRPYLCKDARLWSREEIALATIRELTDREGRAVG